MHNENGQTEQAAQQREGRDEAKPRNADVVAVGVHRIAISNYRIKSMTDSTVTFTAKDYKNQGQWKEVTITGEEFIRRFLMHVPPKRVVRIRHYGLLSSRNKNRKITLCRNLLDCQKYLSRLKDLDAPAIIRLLYNKDVCKCSSCGGKIIPPGQILLAVQKIPAQRDLTILVP